MSPLSEELMLFKFNRTEMQNKKGDCKVNLSLCISRAVVEALRKWL